MASLFCRAANHPLGAWVPGLTDGERVSIVRDNVRNLARFVADNLDVQEPIIEIGSLQVEEQIGYADMRPFFPEKEYIGCDMRSGPGVDRLENVHQLSFESESIGTALFLDTIEHVEFPYRAVKEIHRVLKPGGLIVMTSVMNFPIHDHPMDYWRFTPEAFRALLRPFSTRQVYYQGGANFPDLVIGLAIRDGSETSWPAEFAGDMLTMDARPCVYVEEPEGLQVSSSDSDYFPRAMPDGAHRRTPRSKSAAKKKRGR